jgi:tryptophan synthase alpha chain
VGIARLETTLAGLRERNEAAFVPFLVIGDPDLAATLAFTDALVDGGADILEYGFPFSDPPADGPVIQAADLRALAAGTTPPGCFELLQAVRAKHPHPIALLLYFNLLMQFEGGVDGFYARAADVGVDAILVADVPLDEATELIDAGRKHDIAVVFIGGTFSSDERLRAIATVGTGYLYAVARIGTTGERAGVDPQLAATIARLRAGTNLPILVGFGISTPEQAAIVAAAGADGVIVGSAIVRRIEENQGDPTRAAAEVRRFTEAMKNATRRAARSE